MLSRSTSIQLKLDWLIADKRLRRQSQLYSVLEVDLEAYGLKSFLPTKFDREHVSSLFADAYPEFLWYPWCFRHHAPLSVKFWQSKDNQRKFMDWLKELLQIRNHDEWYRVPSSEFSRHGASQLLELHHGSMFRVLTSVYPEIQWNITLSNEWKSLIHLRKKLDYVADRMGIKKMEDWYAKHSDELRMKGGGSVLSAFNGSFVRALQSLYPEFEWNAWLFDQTPRQYWNDFENQKKAVEWMEEQLGIEHPLQWTYYSHSDIRAIGCRGLLLHYNNSWISLLKTIYPDETWEVDLFQKQQEETNRLRKKMDWLGEQLGFTRFSDWYTLTTAKARKYGGTAVLEPFGDSLSTALQTLYPQYDWLPWCFDQPPKNYWDSIVNQRKCFDWLYAKLGFQHPSQWYGVTVKDVRAAGAGGVLSAYGGSLWKALLAIYPEYAFTDLRKVSKSQTHAMFVLNSLKALDNQFEVNYRHPQLQHSKSGMYMELDYYLPSLSVAFEYQGGYHYESNNVFSPEQYERDKEKRQKCKELGIRLVEIPYWWNGKLTALLSTIQRKSLQMDI